MQSTQFLHRTWLYDGVDFIYFYELIFLAVFFNKLLATYISKALGYLFNMKCFVKLLIQDFLLNLLKYLCFDYNIMQQGSTYLYSTAQFKLDI